MKAIEYKLMLKNWVQSENPTDKEIFAVMHFLDYVEQLEEDNEERQYEG